MKFSKLFAYLLLVSGALFMSSCEDYFDDVNLDPDNPLEVTPGVLLPQIQVRLAYTQGGDLSRFASIYSQHIEGVSRQFFVFQNYNIQPADFDNLWASLYAGIMADNRRLLDIAIAGDYEYYQGVAKSIEAYTIMLTTDFFGDVPYSEAFRGTDLLQPKFDAQQDIYNNIFRLLTEADAHFNAEDGGALVPGGEDLFYGGDIESWKAFVAMVRARAYLHLGEVDNSNYQSALDALNDAGIPSANGSVDARVQFGNSSTQNAPWYQYNQQRTDADIDFDYYVTLFDEDDPRRSLFTVQLTDAGDHPYLIAARNMPIITFAEMKFIEAETRFRLNGAEDAHEAYLEALAAAMEYAGVNSEIGDDYISSIDPGEGNLTLEMILISKYKSLFLEPEVYNDYRRTGIPELIPNTGDAVPLRFVYPQTERQSNKNTPSANEINQFTPVWWDQ